MRSGHESFSEILLDKEFRYELAEGFSFRYGDAVANSEKGKAHAKAFGYFEDKAYRERSPIGYREMTKTPDYRPDLDIYVLSPMDEVASFATMWFDQHNRIGILEPVGTIPEYRKLGLGRACILQLIRQVQEEGGVKVYVGSTQDFYLRIGFRPRDMYAVWVKEVRS